MTGTAWPKGLRLGGLPMAWIAVAALMVRDHIDDPYVADRATTAAAYGHNERLALFLGLGLSFLELAAALLILRPWAPERTLRRWIVGFALYLPWTLGCALLTLHGGGIDLVHLCWLFGLVVRFAVGAVGSELAAMARHGGPARANGG